MKDLTSELSLKNYPKFFAQFLGLTLATGVFVVGQNIAVFGVLAVLLGYLSLYRPKWFIYAALAAMLCRDIFVYEQIYTGWGVSGGYGKGWLILGFLRRVRPNTMVYYNLPRLIFVCMLLRLVVLGMRDKYSLSKLGKKEFYIFLFLLISVLSIAANLSFSKGTINHFVFFCLPFVIYYWFKTVSLSFKDRNMIFGFMMFVCVEMQVLFSIINNFFDVMDGNFFFGDWAVGTFVYPGSEYSAYMLGIGFFVYLYKFLINRNIVDVVRLVIAFYGILSISSILFILILAAFTVFSLFFAVTLSVIRVKEFMLAMFALSLLSLPVVWIINNPELYYDGAHAMEFIEDNQEKDIKDVPKVYSFINLYEMMTEEKRLFLGSGPGSFLTHHGSGPIRNRYHSFTVYNKTTLSSSERLENTVVGLLGEVGPVGFICYFAFFVIVYREINKQNKYRMKKAGKAFPSYVAAIQLILFFATLCLIRNLLEIGHFSIQFFIFIMLVMQHEWHFRQIEDRPAAAAPSPTSNLGPIAEKMRKQQMRSPFRNPRMT
ncbi:hypothetical protein [Pontibacter sp. G13]|uniref:hypothetical protein n=1 Tax=Pontibacter sp. G13 TaxID=3074898 RepID=UPI00288ACDF4|nr:hypothetical protein [Pontibacter sp. G13]WNJ19766.1 hypothetical protein RJD25_04725 [Pontibacter sp. G13]